jgi:hypothetical protein
MAVPTVGAGALAVDVSDTVGDGCCTVTFHLRAHKVWIVGAKSLV